MIQNSKFKIQNLLKWFLATWPRRLVASLLVILFVITPLYYILFTRETEAAWYDENWYYRKSIQITNNTTEETGVYVSVTLDTSDTAKFQPDCGDLRFTKYNGELLPYYIYSGCGTDTTVVYASLDTFPAGEQTIFYYYGNPSAENGFKVADGSGAVTQANMRLSIVNGTAFADFSAADTLTANLNKKVVIADSAGKKLTGYIKAAGTGETYGSETLPNTAFDNTTNVWSFGGETVASVAGGQSGNALQTTEPTDWAGGAGEDIDLSSGGLYLFSTYGKLGTASTLSIAFQEGAPAYHIYKALYPSPSSWTQYTIYATTTQVANGVTFQNTAGTGLYDTASVKQVLTPSATGATITSTTNGSTYNWANEESGFNRNDSSSYTYTIFPSAFSTVASDYTVGDEGTEEQSPAPVGYWSFDEGYGATAHDETNNANDGDITGATWKPESECVSGKCLYFAGDSATPKVEKADTNDTLDLTGSQTWSVWIKPQNIADQWEAVFIKGVAGEGTGFPRNYGLYLNYDEIYISWYNTAWRSFSTTDANLKDNDWYHISYKRDGSNEYIYVNGKLKAQQAIQYAMVANDNEFSIGEGYSTAEYFKGFIDEVKIYPYARTADQIKQDYNAGLAGQSAPKGAATTFGGKSDSWLTDGLVGHWKMDETAGSWDDDNGFEDAVDSSGNGNTGDANGNADSAAGKFGNGGTFDGTGDYVAVADNDAFDFGATEEFSVSTWVKFTNCSTKNKVFVGRDANPDPHWWLGCSINFQLPRFHLVDSTGVGNGVYGASTINDDQWHLVTGVRELNNIRIYVDGVLENTTSHTFSGNFDFGTTLDIGYMAYHLTPDYFYTGKLDEVRIYNRALQPAEVADLYEWAPGPVGHWKMDDGVSGNGETIADSSSYGNNGTTNDGSNDTGMNCAAPGKYGTACEFDGVDDYVQVGNNPLFQWGNGSVSVEMWMKASDITPASTEIFFTKTYYNDGAWNGIDFRLQTDGSLLSVSNAGNPGSFYTNSSISEGWHHYSLVIDYAADDEYWYIDGILDNTQDLASSYNLNNTQDLYIGDYYSHGTYNLNGSIDDVRIYNYARTQKQILADMQGSGLGNLGGLGKPVAHYKFDEGFSDAAYNSGLNCTDASQCVSTQGTLEAGGSGDNATETAMWTKGGKFGGAVEFDGSNDYVSISDDPSLRVSNLTMCSWVKTSDTLGIIATKRYHASADPWDSYLMNVTSSNYNFCISSGSAGSFECLDSNTAVDNTWQHVCGTYDGQTMKIYVDGIEKNSYAYAISIGYSSLPLQIGNYGTGWEFDGLIDEVKIYNYALTADDVKTDYNQGAGAIWGSKSVSSAGVASSSKSSEYCVPGSADPCAAPVGEWKMDENVSGDAQTIYDASGNGNNGTTEIGANGTGMDCSALGKHGYGCEFDGTDDYVDTANISGSALTVEGWVYLTDNSVDRGVVYKSASYILFYDVGDNAWEFIIRDNSSTYHYAKYSQAIPQIGVWNHLVGIWDGSTCYIYVNGVLGATTGSPLSMQSNSNIVKIGIKDTTAFSGKIDDVRIYNYARTPAQVAWDYNRGKPIAEYKFNECQGATIHDESGNGNDGTLTLGASGQTAAGTCTASGTTPWYLGRSGKFGSSLNFDGEDDYVNLGTRTSLNNINSRTISAWINPSSLAGTGSRRIVDNEDGAPNGYFFGAYTSGTAGNSASLIYGQHYTSGYIFFTTPTSSIAANQWWHVAVTYTKGDTTVDPIIYINGVAQALTEVQVSPSGTATVDNGDTLIGALSTGASNFFPGQLDDVKIFNYALTAEQVKDVYNGGAVRF